MNIIILLFVFTAALIFVDFFLAAVIPFFIDAYAKSREKASARIAEKLEESFIFWEKKRMLLTYFAPLILSGIGFLLIRHLAGIILGFILGLYFPALMVSIATQTRIKQFQGQLVDSLMVLSSSLKAGLSLVQAMEVLCDEMPAPVSQEFGLILKENKWGIPLEESLRKLRKRMPLEEVNLVVTSILIARESGGELTKVFSRLVDTIRNNIKLKEKVATLTLQGRLQGYIMMFLPVGFTYFIWKQNPDHFTVMWQTQQGRLMIFIAIGAQLMGMFLIKRISMSKF